MSQASYVITLKKSKGKPRSAKKQPYGAPPIKCHCGACITCRRREQMRLWRAKKRAEKQQ